MKAIIMKLNFKLALKKTTKNLALASNLKSLSEKKLNSIIITIKYISYNFLSKLLDKEYCYF